MININQKDSSGSTALHQACFNTDLKMMEFLLSKGADPNIRYKQHESIVEMLERWLGLFSDKSHRDVDFRNPKDRVEKAIKLLKKYGAK